MVIMKKLIPNLPKKHQNLYHQDVIIVSIKNNDWVDLKISPKDFKALMRPYFDMINVQERREMFEKLKQDENQKRITIEDLINEGEATLITEDGSLQNVAFTPAMIKLLKEAQQKEKDNQ